VRTIYLHHHFIVKLKSDIKHTNLPGGAHGKLIIFNYRSADGAFGQTPPVIIRTASGLSVAAEPRFNVKGNSLLSSPSITMLCTGQWLQFNPHP